MVRSLSGLFFHAFARIATALVALLVNPLKIHVSKCSRVIRRTPHTKEQDK